MRKSVMLMAGSSQSICQAWHLLREIERNRANGARMEGASASKQPGATQR
ncbi:hypothetical protein [Pseudomonas sp.]|jgi:heme exporter protein D|nr:hypothetical protein [Pseudomonas sp.]